MFFVYFLSKQRLRPLGYCAPFLSDCAFAIQENDTTDTESRHTIESKPIELHFRHFVRFPHLREKERERSVWKALEGFQLTGEYDDVLSTKL